MKSNIFLLFTLCAALFTSSCSRDDVNLDPKSKGTLSFASLHVALDASIEPMRSTTSTADYIIRILNANQTEVGSWSYATLPSDVQLQIGSYTLIVQSVAEYAASAFDTPVYGAQQAFTIEAKKTTELGSITCRLVNIKVTVEYGEDLFAKMADDCHATISVGEASLDFVKTEARAGYFAAPAESNVMVVLFEGTVDGIFSTQTKAIEKVQAGQWRRIRYVVNPGPVGSASFTIGVIDEVVEGHLDGNVDDEEGTIGDDPGAPDVPGDAPSITYEGAPIPTDPIVVTASSQVVFRIAAPEKLATLQVSIASTNPDFNGIGASLSPIDLVNPSDEMMQIIGMLSLPSGDAVRGQIAVDFDLTAAMPLLSGFTGEHTFTLSMQDEVGQRCVQPLKLKVVGNTPGGTPPVVTYNGGAVPTDPIVVTESSQIAFLISAANGIVGLQVSISSTNDEFNGIGASLSPIDLVHPSEDMMQIIGMLSLPWGDAVSGKTSVNFDLSAAMPLLSVFTGVHTFVLKITDAEGLTTNQSLQLRVNP